jgi:hypothetical protein
VSDTVMPLIRSIHLITPTTVLLLIFEYWRKQQQQQDWVAMMI